MTDGTAGPVSGSTDFERFFAEHHAPTVRLTHLLTGSGAAAEDLAQDAFTNVLAHFASLDNPAAYLRTAAVNTCRSWHRARGREQDRFRRHGTTPELAPAAQLSDTSADLLASIRLLPYRQQAVLVLRYWLDLTELDIATTLGCRPGTVKSLHARALDAIRKELP